MSSTRSAEEVSVSGDVAQEAAASSVTTLSITCHRRVALQVLLLSVTVNGRSAEVYGLIDAGSEGSFVSSALADKLGVQSTAIEELSLRTLSDAKRTQSRKVFLQIEAIGGRNYAKVQLNDVLMIIDLKIERMPIETFDLSVWPYLKDVELQSIPGQGAEVHMLIKVGAPEVHFQTDHRVGKSGELYAINTRFGLAVMGHVPVKGPANPVQVHFTSTEAVLDTTSQIYER